MELMLQTGKERLELPLRADKNKAFFYSSPLCFYIYKKSQQLEVLMKSELTSSTTNNSKSIRDAIFEVILKNKQARHQWINIAKISLDLLIEFCSTIEH